MAAIDRSDGAGQANVSGLCAGADDPTVLLPADSDRDEAPVDGGSWSSSVSTVSIRASDAPAVVRLRLSVAAATARRTDGLGIDGDGDAGSDAGREPGDRLRVEAYAPVRGGCASDATNLVCAVKCDLSARRARSLGGPRLASPHRDQHWYSRGR